MESTSDSQGKKCPKCFYLRQESDSSPEWQCPNCQIAYAKFESEVDLKAKSSVVSSGDKDGVASSSIDEVATNDSLLSRKFKASSLIGAAIISLTIGYFAGREHVKYEIRTAIQDSLIGLGRSLSGEASQASNVRVADPQRIEVPSIVTATLLEKGFRESDVRQNQYSDLLTFSIRFENAENKPIRAFDGVIDFFDLLNNKILSVSIAINDPLDSGDNMTWRGHIEYNQFIDGHRRLRGMEIQNLKTAFNLRKVLYQDGTIKEF